LNEEKFRLTRARISLELCRGAFKRATTNQRDGTENNDERSHADEKNSKKEIVSDTVPRKTHMQQRHQMVKLQQGSKRIHKQPHTSRRGGGPTSADDDVEECSETVKTVPVPVESPLRFNRTPSHELLVHTIHHINKLALQHW